MREYLRRLVERRVAVWEGAKQLLDQAEAEGRELSGEEQAEFDSRMADIDRLDEEIRAMSARVEAEARADEARAAAEKVVQSHVETPAAEDRASTDVDLLRKIGSGEMRGAVFAARSDEQRDLVAGTGAAGGHTVPIGFYNRLVDHMIDVSGIRAAGPTVLQTTSGEEIRVPRTTAHSSAAIVAEGAAIAESDPAFGQVVLNAFKYGLLIQVSRELIEDTAVDLLGYLAMQAGRAIGNASGAHFISGSGSGQPSGVVPAATVGVTGGTGVGGAFTADNLIDLYHSVISPYRASTSCAWLMRDATLGAVRKLKDSQGQYLWQPSIQVGAPDLLIGKPVYTDPAVPAVGLSARSVVFGDFSRYFIRDVNSIAVDRSDEFAFANDLTTFRFLFRTDGELVDTTGAVKVFVGGAT